MLGKLLIFKIIKILAFNCAAMVSFYYLVASKGILKKSVAMLLSLRYLKTSKFTTFTDPTHHFKTDDVWYSDPRITILFVYLF